MNAMQTRTVRPTVESDRAMADRATAERKAETQGQADLGQALEDLLVGVWRAERVWRLEDRYS
jgi:hypothetical protein